MSVFSNTDSNVFVVDDLPEIVKGALFSRYSRSSKSIRATYETEFKGLDHKADEFYQRVLIGYGDASIAELGGCHLAIEGISQIAVKFIEDNRIGLSFIEKSTRYVDFTSEPYQYYKTDNADINAYIEKSFALYNQLYPQLLTYYKNNVSLSNPDISAKAHNKALECKTLDTLRSLLPLATYTNVGVYGNARAYQLLIQKCVASSNTEIIKLGNQIYKELFRYFGSLIGDTVSERGLRQVSYMKRVQQLRNYYTEDTDFIKRQSNSETQSVKLLYTYASDIGRKKITMAFLYPTIDLDYQDVDIYPYLCLKVISGLLDARNSRFDVVPRCFELVDFTFEIFTDIGTFRDLQRHRLTTLIKSDWEVDLGYHIPEDLKISNLAEPYIEHLDNCPNHPYAKALGHNTKFIWKMNLRELIYILELRTTKQGHEDYRQICIAMYNKLKELYPEIASRLFVDTNSYELSRDTAIQKNLNKGGNI